MGFSGCHISGHSGAANKPRKNTFKTEQKKLSVNLDSQSTFNSDKFGNGKDMSVTKKYQADQFIRSGIKIPLLILFLITCGKALHFYLNYEPKSWLIIREEIILEENAKYKMDLINEYFVLVENGNEFLYQGDFKNAQFEFSKALHLFDNAKSARVGLYTSLNQQCKLHGRYCKAADENLQYLRSNGWAGN